MTRITRVVWAGRIICCLAILLCSLVYPSPVLAGTIRVQRNSIIQNFPASVTFHLTTSSPSTINQVILIYGIQSDSCLAGELRQVFDFFPDQSITLSWDWEPDTNGALPPGVQMVWQWEIHDADGAVLRTDPQTARLEDRHFTWKKLESADLTFYWAKGGLDFGQQLLGISTNSLDRIEETLGVKANGPIQIMVYPSAQDMRNALVSVSDWAGGVAFPDYRVVLIGIDTNSLGWAQQSIPHELTHLITAIRIANCLGGYLPTWLNEGLSEYAQGPVTSQAAGRVVSALNQSALPPLTSLSKGFAADSQLAEQDYDQSWMITSFLIDSFGTEKLNRLLDGIRSGQSIDQAMLAVYGVDTDLLDLTWRASLGYSGGSSEVLPTVVQTLDLVASSNSSNSPVIATQTPSTSEPLSPTATIESPVSPETVQINSKIPAVSPAVQPGGIGVAAQLLGLAGIIVLVLMSMGIALIFFLHMLKSV